MNSKPFHSPRVAQLNRSNATTDDRRADEPTSVSAILDLNRDAEAGLQIAGRLGQPHELSSSELSPDTSTVNIPRHRRPEIGHEGATVESAASPRKQEESENVEAGSPLRSEQSATQLTEVFHAPSTGTSQRRTNSSLRSRAVPSRRLGANLRRPGTPRVKRRIPQEMQAQWRVGAAPSIALALSREESQMSKIISQAQAFHSSMFEVIWSPKLRDNEFIFDLDNRVEVFRDTSVTVTGLVAAGKQQLAEEILNRMLPMMDDVLRDQPPALYLILAEISLGLVKTPNNALRDQIARYMAIRAHSVLGAEHPITVLLTAQLPPSKKEILGDRIWEMVIPILARSFGSDHYQSSTQVFCQARNMAACGRLEEAVKKIETCIEQWSRVYGNNSLIVCYSKIELANTLVNAGLHMKAEFVVSDALRTSDMIQAAELRNEDCHASERRHRASSIAYPKVAGLRTLGKIHTLRGNFGAAKYYYTQAIAIGQPLLGKNNGSVELAQSDLDKVCQLEVQQSLNQLTLAEVSRLTDIVGSPIG